MQVLDKSELDVIAGGVPTCQGIVLKWGEWRGCLGVTET